MSTKRSFLRDAAPLLIIAAIFIAFISAATISPTGLSGFSWLNATSMSVDNMYINDLNLTDVLNKSASGYVWWSNPADDNYFFNITSDGMLHYTKEIANIDLFNVTKTGEMVVRDNLTVPYVTTDSVTLDGVTRTTWPSALGLADQGLNTTDSVVFAELNTTGKSELGTQLNVTDEIDVNFEWSGEAALLRAGEAIAAGQLVHVNATGWIKLTDADSNLTIPCIAIALEAINDGDYGLFLMQGWVYNGAWTLTEGRDVYISTTTGALTVTAPSGSGDQVQVIGIGFTEDLLYFNPDYTILEVL